MAKKVKKAKGKLSRKEKKKALRGMRKEMFKEAGVGDW